MDEIDLWTQDDQFKAVPFNKTAMNRLTVSKNFNPFASTCQDAKEDSINKLISKISISNPQWSGGW